MVRFDGGNAGLISNMIQRVDTTDPQLGYRILLKIYQLDITQESRVSRGLPAMVVCGRSEILPRIRYWVRDGVLEAVITLPAATREVDRTIRICRFRRRTRRI